MGDLKHQLKDTERKLFYKRAELIEALTRIAELEAALAALMKDLEIYVPYADALGSYEKADALLKAKQP